MREMEGVGTKVLYKFDQQLFRRSTRGANHHLITECQFADDVALLATSREAAEEAIRTYQLTAKEFGLTLSTTKTKFMVVGHRVTEEEKLPITVEGGMVEHVPITVEGGMVEHVPITVEGGMVEHVPITVEGGMVEHVPITVEGGMVEHVPITVEGGMVEHVPITVEGGMVEHVPITVEGGMVEHVEHFQYLGSLISENGQIYRC